MASFLLAYTFRDYLNEVFLMPFSQFAGLALLLALLWTFSFILTGLYSFSLKRGSLDELLKTILGCSTAITLSLAAVYSVKQFAFSRLVILLTWVLSILLVVLFRYLLGLGQSLLYRAGKGTVRVIIVGDEKNTKLVQRGYEALNDPRVEITASYIDVKQAIKVIEKHEADEVVLASGRMDNPEAEELMETCESCGIIFKFVPDIFHSAGVRVATYDLAGVPMIEIKATALEGWSQIIKRLEDIFFSSAALIATSPILLLTAIAIKLDTPGTILYRDRRVGRNGREFDLYKFRSMSMIVKNGEMVHAIENEEVEELKAKQKNYKLEHDPRVTKVGYFIRRTSIDELPQFWNVLRGEMSVVGPRTYRDIELRQQRERFPDTKALVRRLLTVKPGITGIWQVSGRSEIEFTERVAMDAYYATNTGLLGDFKIILRTIPVVVKGSGAM